MIKRVFGFAKVRYRGLAKNTHRAMVACGLANLFMVRHRSRQKTFTPIGSPLDSRNSKALLLAAARSLSRRQRHPHHVPDNHSGRSRVGEGGDQRAVAQIAHGFGRNAVDKFVPLFAVERRRLAGFDD